MCIIFIYKFTQIILHSDKYLCCPILTKIVMCRQILIYLDWVNNNNNIWLKGSQVSNVDRQREVTNQ
jgi:hypothetical protein